MTIADGEYDIDLSVLTASEQDASLAIRYGFIPDSMDQKSALRLYQGDQICIMEAQSSEKLKNDAAPIIFEGVPQRSRSQGSAAPSDSYYLSFQPDSLGGDVKVALRKLGSTIRVTKSRNADKWRRSIREWKSQGGNTNADLALDYKVDQKGTSGTNRTKVDVDVDRNTAGKGKTDEGKIAGQSPKNTSAINATQQGKPSGKRPPERSATNDIISVSDFEDLGSDSDATESRAGQYSPVSSIKKASPSQNRSRDLEMEDEWADLEDQLEEVLDSSDDSFEGVKHSAPIIIDVKDDGQTPSQTIKPKHTGSRAPMSLRQLHGNPEVNDYLSSSEEE